MLNPVHNHSATMPPPLILMSGVEWTSGVDEWSGQGQLGRVEPL